MRSPDTQKDFYFAMRERAEAQVMFVLWLLSFCLTFSTQGQLAPHLAALGNVDTQAELEQKLKDREEDLKQ